MGKVRKGGLPAPRVSLMFFRVRLGRLAGLDIVDGDLLGTAGTALALALAVAVLVELEAAVAVFVGAEGVGLVDLGRVGEFAVGFPWGVLVAFLLSLFFVCGERLRTRNGPRRPST